MDEATLLIARLEGYRAESYKDTAGVWTIGFGTTIYPNGSHVQENQTCNMLQAETYLQHHLQTHVYPQLKNYMPIPPRIFSALSSLIYNVGSLGDGTKNIVKLKLWTRLPDFFRKYIYVNGVPSIGLKKRREAEIQYFIKDITT